MKQKMLSHDNLPQLLLKARESIFRHFKPIVAHAGLTEQQWRVLRTVTEHGALEPREICDLCQILSPSMAGVLARMEEKGLVERCRFEDDQRRVRVTPTQKGKNIVLRLAPMVEQQYAYLEQALGAELVHNTYALLETLLAKEKNTVVKHVDLSTVEKEVK